MSLERRLRRQQQKKNGGTPPKMMGGNPFQQLQHMLGDLKQVQGLGEAAKGVQALGEKLQDAQGLVEELSGLRDELSGALDRIGGYEYELEKQRVVFMRFLFQSDLLVGPGDYIAKYLGLEARYRAEYDAMRFLMTLAIWAKEAP